MYVCGWVGVAGCLMCFTLSRDKGDGDGVQGTLSLVWFGSAWPGSTPQIFDASTSKRCQQTLRLHLQPEEEQAHQGQQERRGSFLHQACTGPSQVERKEKDKRRVEKKIVCRHTCDQTAARSLKFHLLNLLPVHPSC